MSQIGSLIYGITLQDVMFCVSLSSDEEDDEEDDEEGEEEEGEEEEEEDREDFTALKNKKQLINGHKKVGFPDESLSHSERRPQNIYSQEEINLYCIIKLATEISLFSLQISKTWCFV